jgi:hypothetical protein
LNPTAGWVAFRDPSGVEFSHPASWTTQPAQLGPLYVFIDPAQDAGSFRRNINMLVQPVAPGFTLDDYTRTSLTQMSAAGASVGEVLPTTLGGLPAGDVSWSLTKSGQTLRFLSWWAVRGKQAFLVTYSSAAASFDAPLLDVDRLINSITLPPAG